MKQIERILIGALAAGVWSLVVLQVTSNGQAYAQLSSEIEQAQEDRVFQNETTIINASDIVGLSALIEKTIRDHQLRPQSTPGLEQYVKSVVRRCRVNGSVRGDRISSATISC